MKVCDPSERPEMTQAAVPPAVRVTAEHQVTGLLRRRSLPVPPVIAGADSRGQCDRLADDTRIGTRG